jgi:hypothetical protein
VELSGRTAVYYRLKVLLIKVPDFTSFCQIKDAKPKLRNKNHLKRRDNPHYNSYLS